MDVLMATVTSETYRKFHRRWVDALLREGHSVHWASEDWGDRDLFARAGVRFHEVPVARDVRPLKALRARSALRALLRKIEPDVLVTEGTVPSLVAATAMLGRRRHRVLRVVHSWPWHDLTPGAVRVAEEVAEKAGARWTDHAHFVNREDHETALALRMMPRERTSVYPVGIDPSAYAAEPSPERVAAVRRDLGLGEAPTFLFVGRIARYKGVFDVVSAFESARESLPASRLVIIGRPDQRPGPLADAARLQEVVEREPLRGSVTWRPRCDDLPALYRACDVFVMPSIYEGLGLVYIEAGAMGIPSIGYDVRGVREAIVHQQTGLLVPPRDVAALASAMVDLGKDASARAKMGDAGRTRWRDGFNNEVFAQTMVDLIRRLGRARS